MYSKATGPIGLYSDVKRTEARSSKANGAPVAPLKFYAYGLVTVTNAVKKVY